MRASVNMTDSSSLIVTSLRLPFVTFNQVKHIIKLRVISQLLFILVKFINLREDLEIVFVFGGQVKVR